MCSKAADSVDGGFCLECWLPSRKHSFQRFRALTVVSTYIANQFYGMAYKDIYLLFGKFLKESAGGLATLLARKKNCHGIILIVDDATDSTGSHRANTTRST